MKTQAQSKNLPSRSSVKKPSVAPAPEFKPGEEHRGILLERVDREAITKYLVLKGVRFPITAGIRELVEIYADHYLDEEQKVEDTYECEECHASVLQEGRCPVCNSGDDAPAQVVPEPEPEPEPEPAKPKTSPKVVQAIAPVEAHAGEVVVPGSLADLDASVVKIRQCTTGTIEQLYELGREIAKVMDTGSWKLRLKGGSPKYKVVAEFFETECNMKRSLAFETVAIVKSFALEEVKRIGFSKLGRIINAPQEHRDRLLTLAGDASYREIRTEIRKLAPPIPKAPKPRGTASRMKEAESRSTAAPTRERPKGSVTTTFTLGKNELDLTAKKSGEKVSFVAEEVLADGCKITYTVSINPNGKKGKLTIDRKSPV